MIVNWGRTRSSERGFTLIELLVVIIILGVLSALVVLAVGAITDKGTGSACKTDRKHIEVAEEAYYAKNGAYIDIAGLVSNKLLREAPETSHYVISVNTATGDVTADHSNCSAF
jgi:prepilin-type N-terminal cleavage/methylation domain-containing protein